MSDDEDYCDVGSNDIVEEAEPALAQPNLKNGKRIRGKDIDWFEFLLFDTTDGFMKSDLHTELKKEFTMKMAREPEYADTENYVCKFARRRGYLPCPLQYKVSFLSHSEEVKVEANAVHPRHKHDPDPEYGQQVGSIYRWSAQQTEMISQGVRNEAKPKVCHFFYSLKFLIISFIRLSDARWKMLIYLVMEEYQLLWS